MDIWAKNQAFIAKKIVHKHCKFFGIYINELGLNQFDNFTKV